MPKNPIQCQKGYSLPKFLAAFGTEEKCRQKLFSYRWPSGFICPKCSHTQYYELKSRRLYQCRKCRHQASLTSGTIFSSSKLPLTTWFMAICLITQAKEGMSALSMRRFLGISINAGLKMKHKLQHDMKQADNRLILEGFIELDDVYWGGKRSGGKRGRGAPGKTPFLAAISRNEKGRPVYMRMSKLSSFTLSEVATWCRKHLHTESVVISDMYTPFKCLSSLVAVHGRIKAKKIYDDRNNKIFHWINIMIGNVKKAIHGTYHAVSLKHLPRYFAEFCFRFNNRFIIGAVIPNLAREAMKTKPRPQRRLKLADSQG